MKKYPPALSLPPLPACTWTRYVVATGISVLVLLGGIVVDDLLLPETRELLYSDVLTSLVAGILAFLVSRCYASQRHAMAERRRITAEVNHHVRNALTGIFCLVEARNDPELTELTQEAVERIDRVLREVLPSPATAPRAERGE